MTVNLKSEGRPMWTVVQIPVAEVGRVRAEHSGTFALAIFGAPVADDDLKWHVAPPKP